ncbi:hypothetical protein BD770DRAFT_395934 [Pilaira anomala]|nr:hypothetical protein BD770DRAFT_395934 [Pilaira anomala]
MSYPFYLKTCYFLMRNCATIIVFPFILFESELTILLVLPHSIHLNFETMAWYMPGGNYCLIPFLLMKIITRDLKKIKEVS